MNLKALITSLVLGSSTMASAGTLTFSGKASVSFSASAGTPIVRDHRAAPAPVVVRDHRADPCGTTTTPAPVQRPWRPTFQHVSLPPVWAGPYYEPHNTVVGRNVSNYTGEIGISAIKPLFKGRYGFVVSRWASQSWLNLTEPTRIDSGREFIKVGADKGLFQTLQLQNLGARSSTITQVAIEFADGLSRTQVVKLDNRKLDMRHPTITIDLTGNFRQIKRIVVYGSTERGAAYKILAK